MFWIWPGRKWEPRVGRGGVRRHQRGPALGSGEALPRRITSRHPRHQEPQAGFWFGQEAVEAEGTGRARVGSIRSPLWRHGGTVHGPQPRSYDYQFPRKKVLGALRSALAAKAADGKLTVVEAFDLKEVKSKAMRQVLAGLKADKTVLLVEAGNHENLNLELSPQPGGRGDAVRSRSSSLSPAALRLAIFSRPALERLQRLAEGFGA